MSDYNEQNDVFAQIDNTETKVVELISDKEPHELEVDEAQYGINKPTRKIIRARISYGKS